MTHRDDLTEKLVQIKRLAEEALEEIGRGARSKRKGTQKARAPRPARKTLRAHILQLRDAGFFRQSKAAPEIHRKLQPTYPCDLNRVEVALYRLKKGRRLRKTSKGKKKQVAYVW